MFANVDLLDQSSVQIEAAKSYIPEIRNFYNVGAQQFNYEYRYDCIWIQWLLMFLPDLEAVEFLYKSKLHLTETTIQEDGSQRGGLIFVKENISPGNVGLFLDRE